MAATMTGLRLLVALAIGLWGVTASAAEVPAARVQVDLISELQAIPAGATFWVGLRQRIAPGWHTYWINPGDSGEPAEIAWTLPDGFSAGPIAWPHPTRIPVGPVMSYGYSREITLPIPITAPAGLTPGATVTLRGQARWLVCEKICIPEEAPVALTLPVSSGSPLPAADGVVAAARRSVPAPSPWPASFAATADRVRLSVAAQGLSAERMAEVWFYPARWGVIEHAAPQRARVDAQGITLDVARGQLPEATAGPIEGVLVIAERLDTGVTRQAFVLRAEPRGAVSAALPLAHVLALALAGGLILNLMPCVLPVLSVKALALLDHEADGARLRWHGLVYTLGVLASFAALAGTLLALRAAGEQIGWGFQLQSPMVVTLLAYVLFAMGLVLSGILVVGGRFTGAGGWLAARPGHAGAFFTGALATVAATPCTAPFMGTALGVAVTQPWPTALLIFEALGLGLALPYLALSLVPGWRSFLPRPGAWMHRLSQLLAFPLYASAAWLVWVVSQQAGSRGVALALAGLLLIAFAAWLYGATRDARVLARRTATAAAIGVAAVAVAVSAVISAEAPPATGRVAEPGRGPWEPFSPDRLSALRAHGTPVLVNVTAAWCITCLVNERVALSSPAVAEALARKGVVALQADWTRRDPEITQMLAAFGRNGVPLYLLYPRGAPGSPGRPTVLPQVLSEGAIIEAIEKI
jgi:thiol:disulfide interchange protein DsbD